jgi:hypothetical protein
VLPKLKSNEARFPIPKDDMPREFEDFKQAAYSDHPPLRTVQGAWPKFLLGNLRTDTREALVSRITQIWTEQIQWKNNNAVICYPIALAEPGAKTISLSASTVVYKDADPEEILDWVISLWLKKSELYGEEQVGSYVALNVKELFYLKDFPKKKSFMTRM